MTAAPRRWSGSQAQWEEREAAKARLNTACAVSEPIVAHVRTAQGALVDFRVAIDGILGSDGIIISPNRARDRVTRAIAELTEALDLLRRAPRDWPKTEDWSW